MAKDKRITKNRLTELREAGIVLSQDQVGTLLGLDGTTVSRHEGGQRGLTKEQIEAYAKLYHVPTHEIFFIATVPDEEEQPQRAGAGVK